MQHYTALVFHQAQAQRIESKLAEFLPPHEARELAKQVYDLVLDVDEDIDRILQDPLVGTIYDYDGQFFTPRGTVGFHAAFNGLHILKSLGNYIDPFFRAQPKRSAIRRLLDELNMHRWVAKRRRMNWEELGTLSLIPEETIREIINARRRAEMEATPQPLSIEEQAFFECFEEQLKEQKAQ
jgi:hypothetical protein